LIILGIAFVTALRLYAFALTIQFRSTLDRAGGVLNHTYAIGAAVALTEARGASIVEEHEAGHEPGAIGRAPGGGDSPRACAVLTGDQA